MREQGAVMGDSSTDAQPCTIQQTGSTQGDGVVTGTARGGRAARSDGVGGAAPWAG